MSVLVSSLVWQYSKAKNATLLVALALADRSDDDGVSFPAVASLAVKARCGIRSVQYALGQLVEFGELEVETGAGPKGCNLYRIRVQNLRGADFAPPQNSTDRGALGCTQYIIDTSIRRKEEKRAPAQAVSFDFETGLFHGLDGYHFDRLQDSFPATDAVVEFKRAANWLIANPSNRKSNYLRFLTTWLTRAQDRAPRLTTITTTGNHHATRPKSAADKREEWSNELFGASRRARAARDAADATFDQPPSDPSSH